MREYTASGPITANDVAELLPARYHAQPGRRTRIRRTWLDTADARLADRGISLVHVADGDRCRLAFDDGATSRELPAGADPPRWPADLPAAAARRIANLVDVRALLAQHTERGPAVVVHVLDDEEKTVSQVWLERLDGGERRVRVEALRGYDRAADRVSAAMARDARLTPVPPRPVPRPPAPPLLRRDMSTNDAVGAVLAHLFDVVEANVEGTVAALDTEFLHELRVGVRRTRSALKLTAGDLPLRLGDRFEARFRWLGDLTTPARDLDVLLLELQSGAGASGGDPDLEPLLGLLSERHAEAYAALAKGLRSARFRQLGASYRGALGRLATATRPDDPIGPAADAWATRAMRRVLRRGRAVTPGSPPADVHDVRKRCKELRYCLELFGSVWEPVALDRLVSELKVLQDTLGAYQDSEVHHAMLTAWAEQIESAGRARAATLTAIGRLTSQLDEKKAAARADFAPRFARFARPANLRRFEAMTSGGRG